MKRLVCVVVLFLGTAAAGADEAELPKIEPPPYAETFQNRSYPNVEAFTAELRALKSPWRELFVDADEESGEYSIAPYDKLETVETIYAKEKTAIVFAEAERFRTSFCAVVFLLRKNGDGMAVGDIIRRDGIGYSTMDTPEMLKLEPAKYPHLHLSVYNGGRRWGRQRDELFVVAESGESRVLEFKPTLPLRDGFFMEPTHPWHSFEQEAKLQVREGRLRIEVTRTWGLDAIDKEQTLAVDFHWNARREKFESVEVSRITLAEPEIWDGAGLPKPPRNAKSVKP